MTDAPSTPVRPVLFATTAEGFSVPVVDVTHPAFATDLGDATLPGRVEAYVAEETQRQRQPRWLTRLMLAIFGRKSYLIRAMARARAGYLPALTTYYLKLGAPNLVPPLDNDIDRRIVSSLAGQSLRLRLGQVAELLATSLAPQIEVRPGTPLELVNIAGGPAMDSLNALILLKRDHPAVLAGRPIRIHVLDIDPAGPHFGRNALEALEGTDAPLSGLAVELRHVDWNWRDLPLLAAFLEEIGAREAIVAASSEGGLFEYGSDAEIGGVLRTLAGGTGPETVVAGSVTRNDPPTQLFTRSSMFPIVPRGVDNFSKLAAASGWTLAETRRAAFADQVLLRKP